MTILALQNSRLDLAVGHEPLTSTFNQLHEVRLVDTQYASLRRHGSHAIVEGSAPRKSLTLLGEDGSTTDVSLQARAVHPSALGPLTVSTTDQVVYQWEPGQAPRERWKARESGDHTAFSLGRDRLLVVRVVGKEDHGAYALSLTGPAERLWSLSPGRHVDVIAPQGILSTRFDENGANVEIDCHDPATGELRWCCPWRLGDAIAIVDDVLWQSGHYCLERVELRTGTRLADVSVRQAVAPGGLVDERGIFHCSHGFNYQQLDLRDNGRVLTFVELESTALGPKLGAGPNKMALADDGRMVFGDEGGSIWVVHPERPTKPEQVWRGEGRIMGMVVQQGKLWIDLYSNGHTYVLLG